MKSLAIVAAAAALFVAAPAWASTTIDFDSYTPGPQTNPFTDSGATFEGSESLYVLNFLSGANQQLCSVSGGYCAGALNVSFASAVSGLSFYASADDDDAAGSLSVLLTLADTTTETVLFALDGDINTYDLIDLSSYSNIVGFSVSSADTYGVIYDDFTFSEAVTATPEPATWLMLILGFGIMGSAVRRRRLAGAAIA